MMLRLATWLQRFASMGVAAGVLACGTPGEAPPLAPRPSPSPDLPMPSFPGKPLPGGSKFVTRDAMPPIPEPGLPIPHATNDVVANPGESTASSSDPSVPSRTAMGAQPTVAAIERLATTDAGSPPFDGGTLGDGGTMWRSDAPRGGVDAGIPRDASTLPRDGGVTPIRPPIGSGSSTP